MVQSDATNYFWDVYELGADASLSLEEKIERAITTGCDRLNVPYGVLSYTGSGEYEIVERVVSGHGWQGAVDVQDGTRSVFSGVGEVTERPLLW